MSLNQKDSLIVWLYFWRIKASGKPRYVMLDGSRQVACRDLAAARKYAQSHGYPGIKIVPR